MHGVNLAVLEAVLGDLERDKSVYLGTVLQTWGASPRPVGSLFAYCPATDTTVGSISGGCIEDDLLGELSVCEVFTTPQRRRYGDSAEQRKRLQLPCGGTLEILLQYVDSTAKTKAHYRSLVTALVKRQRITRRVDLLSGESSIHLADNTVGIHEVKGSVEHTLGPQDRLLILGAGEIARYLIPIASSLDFSVSLCDPRPDYLARNLFLDRTGNDYQCLDSPPDDLVREQFNDNYCAIVAVAHDPRVDDLALIAALQGEAFYIGAMGSQRSSEKRLNRLEALGFDQSQLQRIHAPIGLSVASKTPPEIAVSIAAQLVEQRHRRIQQASVMTFADQCG